MHGNLAADTGRYLDFLERRQPEILREVCERAVASTRTASREQRDPKPDFYAELFRHANQEERAEYLKDHPWTRQLLALLAANDLLDKRNPSGNPAVDIPESL